MVTQLQSFFRKPLLEKSEALSQWYWLIKTQFYYRRFFGAIGQRTRIIKPMRLKGVEYISLGRDVTVNKHAWLQPMMLEGTPPRLIIGDGCVIGNFSHVTCVTRVELGEKVLLADRVFITDHGHQFRDPNVPIMDQGVAPGRPVSIGAGSWLGENVVVLSASIGRNCVVGANSVVLSDLPDHSVAVGAPARVIRRFNPRTAAWERIEAPVSVC